MAIKVPIHFIYLQGVHAYIDIVIDNCQHGKLLIDTGASQTIFSSNNTDINSFITPIDQNEFVRCYPLKEQVKLPVTINQQFGFDDDQIVALTANMPVNLQFGLIAQLQIGDLSIEHLPVARIDLSQITKMYADYYDIHNIWGLLGSDLLYLYRAKLNFSNETLELLSKPRNLDYKPKDS